MRTNNPATERRIGRPATGTDRTAPAHRPAPETAYDGPGFAGATFTQQVPDLLTELRLGRHAASGWGAAGTRFPE